MSSVAMPLNALLSLNMVIGLQTRAAAETHRSRRQALRQLLESRVDDLHALGAEVARLVAQRRIEHARGGHDPALGVVEAAELGRVAPGVAELAEDDLADEVARRVRALLLLHLGGERRAHQRGAVAALAAVDAIDVHAALRRDLVREALLLRLALLLVEVDVRRDQADRVLGVGARSEEDQEGALAELAHAARGGR